MSKTLIESHLMVKNKQGNTVPFILNTIQRRLHQDRAKRNVVLKLRQPGVTTYEMARAFIRTCIVGNWDHAVIAHKKTSEVLKPLREKLETFLLSIPEWMRGDAKYESLDYVHWPSRNSSFRILSGGTGNPLQSTTVQSAHFTEMALWEGNVEEAVTGALDAIPLSGEVTIESRGQAPSGWFYDFYGNSKNGKTGYKSHFYGLKDFPEYDERFLEAKRREYLGHEYLFKQHYPMNDVEAFQSSPNCYFADCPLDISHEPQEPTADFKYVVAADIASGSPSGNFSAYQVLELTTGRQVASWAGRERPSSFAHRLLKVAIKYNEALIAPERNYESEVIITTIEDSGYEFLYYDDAGKAGIKTDSNTRPTMLQELMESLCTGETTLCCEETIREMRSFCLQKNGRYKANSGAYDDLVMSLALARYAANRWSFDYTPALVGHYPEG